MKRAIVICAVAAFWIVSAARQGTAASSSGGRSIDPMPGSPSVTGTVSIDKTLQDRRVRLPGKATLHLEIVDISGSDPRIAALGEETIWIATGKFPVDFRIAYDPSRIDPAHTYAVRARIMDGEKVLYLNTKPYHVITRGAPSKIDVVVVPVQVRVR